MAPVHIRFHMGMVWACSNECKPSIRWIDYRLFVVDVDEGISQFFFFGAIKGKILLKNGQTQQEKHKARANHQEGESQSKATKERKANEKTKQNPTDYNSSRQKES